MASTTPSDLELQHFSGFCLAGNKNGPRAPAREMGER